MYNNAIIYDRFQTLQTADSLLLELLFVSCENILELACGTGRLYPIFKDKNYVGIDISTAMLNEFKNKYSPDFLICGDISRIPLKNVYDGLVLSLNSIHHLDDESLSLLLLEIDRVSTNGSILAIEMTDFDKIPWVNGAFYSEYYEYATDAGMLLKQIVRKDDEDYLFERSYYQKDKLVYEESSKLYSHSLSKLFYKLSEIKFKKIPKTTKSDNACIDGALSIQTHIFVKK
ncbi:MAG: class I SAM-dependent methyltransferase [Candidatus Cloacimonetes bacterium]|nr:class I SAM-dependent methyltransferase [Candidatus Cloacimonadota bacterium]